MAWRCLLVGVVLVLASCGEEKAGVPQVAEKTSRGPGTLTSVRPQEPAPQPQTSVAVRPATATAPRSDIPAPPPTPPEPPAEPARPTAPPPNVTPIAPRPEVAKPEPPAPPKAPTPEKPAVEASPHVATPEKPIVVEPERNVWRLKRQKSVDREGIGIEAFSLLVPEGWTLSGGVLWPLENPGMPGNMAYCVSSPSGSEELRVFPTFSYMWTDDPKLLKRLPAGSKHLGSHVRAPMKPTQFLRDVIVPRLRGGAKGLRVTDTVEFADLAAQLGAGKPLPRGARATMAGGKLKLEYIEGGQAMEEELLAAVESQAATVPTDDGMVTTTNWVVSYLFSFRAPKGVLAKRMGVFQTVARSFRIHPRWFHKYHLLIQLLVQNRVTEIESASRIRKLLEGTPDPGDAAMASWRDYNATYGRMFEIFAQGAGGVERYHDPLQKQDVHLPAGRARAWTNGLGDYAVADDAAFDPNPGSDLTWTRLKRAEPEEE